MNTPESTTAEEAPAPKPGRGRLVILSILLASILVGAIALFNYHPTIHLEAYEKSVFSQNGEDGVIEKIFEVIEPTSKFCIEFGAGDGTTMSNVRNLIVNKGWGGFLIEGDEKLAAQMAENYKDYPKLKSIHAWVYPGNVETLFEENGVPLDLDFLVIDIDSNDYYVWKVIHRFRPKLVMIEHNGIFAPPIKLVVDFHPMNYWDKTIYWGASLQSLYELGKQKGYELIYVDKRGINLFFVDEKYFKLFGIEDNSPATLYRPHDYKYSIRDTADLMTFMDEDGYLKESGIDNPAFKPDPLTWDSFEIKKRFIIGR